MADDSSDVSDGSDIEADYEPDFEDVDVPEDPLDEDQWVRDFFEENSSDEESLRDFRDPGRVIAFNIACATPTDVPQE